jgi:hypothetical protein
VEYPFVIDIVREPSVPTIWPSELAVLVLQLGLPVWNINRVVDRTYV